jgi:hypothetical protein
LYVQGPDQWTGDPAKAADFKMIDKALTFARIWDLEDVEIAFAFDEARHITGVPLDKLALRFSED